jgi:hypothetical protein
METEEFIGFLKQEKVLLVQSNAALAPAISMNRWSVLKTPFSL